MTASVSNILVYREMLKIDPRSPVFCLLAEELSSVGEWKETEEVCRKGLQYHPDHFRGRVLLGWALKELGQSEESEKILRELEEEIRKNSLVFKMLSEFAVSSGDSARAQELARIYDMFEGPPASAAGVQTKAPEAPKGLEAAAAFAVAEPEQALSESAAPEIEMPPEPPAKVDFGRLEAILAGLADKVEARCGEKGDLSTFLDASDRDYLKQTVLAELMTL